MSVLTAALIGIPLRQEFRPIRFDPGILAPRQAQIIFVRSETGADLATAGLRLWAEMELSDGRWVTASFSQQSTGFQSLLRMPARAPLSTVKRIRIGIDGGLRSRKWTVPKLSVSAMDQGTEFKIAEYVGFGIALDSGQRWTSPILLDASDELELSPDKFELELRSAGSDPRRRLSRAIAELETVDGRVFYGTEDLNRYVIRFESRSGKDRIKVGDVARVRVGFTGGPPDRIVFARLLDTGDGWDLGGIALVARAPMHQVIPIVEMPELNKRFLKSGWLDLPSFRRFAPHIVDEPIRFVEVDVFTGAEAFKADPDLRVIRGGDSRLELFAGNPDSTNPIPLVNFSAEPSTLAGVNDITVPIRRFPQGWTGKVGSGQILSRQTSIRPEIAAQFAALTQLTLDFLPGSGDTWTYRGMTVNIRYVSKSRRIFSELGVDRTLTNRTRIIAALRPELPDVAPR